MHNEISLALHRIFDLSLVLGVIVGIISISISKTKKTEYFIIWASIPVITLAFGAAAGIKYSNLYIGIISGSLSLLSLIIGCYLLVFLNLIYEVAILSATLIKQIYNHYL